MKLLSTLAISLCLFASPAAQAQDAASEAPAKAAALQWLALSDAGNYAATWEQAGKSLKDQVSRSKWQSVMQNERAPLGGLKARQFKRATFMKQVTGLPDGEYCELEFNATFERPAALVEAVGMQKDSDGVWRVIGYFAKPR